MAAEPVLPTLRAVVFAVVCLGLGAGAHTLMTHAGLPAWAWVLGAIAAYAPARVAAARRERGLAAIAGCMVGLQVALHVLFYYAQLLTQSTMPPGMRMSAGMRMSGMTEVSATGWLHLSSGMLLGHVLAALVCSWWLRCGEAAVHTLVRNAAFRLRAVWVVLAWIIPPADRTPGRVRLAPYSGILGPQWLRGVIARRGPPLPA